MTIGRRVGTLTSPPRETARKLRRRAGGMALAAFERRRAELLPTYSTAGDDGSLLRRFLPDGFLPALPHDAAALAAAHLHASATFDVLGSGWVRPRAGRLAAGFLGHPVHRSLPVHAAGRYGWVDTHVGEANRATARRVWDLLDDDYEPVDWHTDVRSGYRWDPRTWHADVVYGDQPGVDVKVPWELSRLQHLPQLAVAHHGAVGEPAAGWPSPDVLVRAVRNQTLDFVATNPPGFGVNWACAMDVAIRAANLALAVELLRSQQAPLDTPFLDVVAASLRDHARFVAGHLEWHDVFRSNHYLADVVGLLFVARAVASPEADGWLSLAVRELAGEARLQFDRDGANAEGSTCYHRLSGELVVFGTAAAAGLDERTLPIETQRHLASLLDGRHGALLDGIRAFTEALTAPDGHVVQIGDNDSGRLFKLQPVWVVEDHIALTRRFANLPSEPEVEGPYLCEDVLDHRHLLSAVAALRPRRAIGPVSLDACVVAGLRGAAVGALAGQSGARRVEVTVGATAQPAAVTPRASRTHRRRTVRLVPGGPPLDERLSLVSFPAFGVYVVRSLRLFLTFRCGPLGQRGNGGHAHNDQLSIELWVDGLPWIRDPGTGVYTADGAVRNRYRSARAHAGPPLVGEPWGLDAGLFTLAGDPAGGEIVAARPDLLAGRFFLGDSEVTRTLTIDCAALTVVDGVPASSAALREDVDETVATAADARRVLCPDAPPQSPGYGWVPGAIF